MRRFNFGFMIVLISLSAGAQGAYGQICVTSDSNDNTACGSDTLPSGSGYAKSAFGQSSLAVDTTGAANTAVGAHPLQTNSIGSQNTAVGAQALEFNTAGNQNTAIGNYALQFSTVASNNTACGYAALYQNTTGSYNTCCLTKPERTILRLDIPR